jgi:hypothetical protein
VSPSHPLNRLRELLQLQAAAIEEGDSEQLTALDAELATAVADLPPNASGAAERALAADVEALRARNEHRLTERLAEVGSRITRIGYGRVALRAYSPAGGSIQALRAVDQGA